MSLRDEKVFSDEEMVAAFALILPPERAREEGLAWNALPDVHAFEHATPEELRAAGVAGPRSYDGDLLDFHSLVSDDCARRAWQLMGVSPEEGERRRAVFRGKVELARRAMGWEDAG